MYFIEMSSETTEGRKLRRKQVREHLHGRYSSCLRSHIDNKWSPPISRNSSVNDMYRGSIGDWLGLSSDDEEDIDDDDDDDKEKNVMQFGNFDKPELWDILMDAELAAGNLQLQYGWNFFDCSSNIRMKNKITFRRRPVLNSTDCIRGKVGITNGYHMWAVQWATNQRGTHAVFGVATSKAPVHSYGYRSLVGYTDQSWGWDLCRNILLHNSKSCPPKPYPENNKNFVVPNKFLDMENGTLAFVVKNQYLGIAFRGLEGKTLYPIVSSVWGKCTVTLKYLGAVLQPKSLWENCCEAIRNELDEDKIEELELPKIIKNSILDV